MAEFVRAIIADIHIGDRLRPISDPEVQAMAASLSQHGQISPIMIRRTPAKNKGATPYMLVAGGYRATAALLLGWTEIDAMIVAADQAEAQMLEIQENLFRNELNPLDRAVFVMTYRELWEKKHGKIQPGGDQKSKGTECPLIFASGRELSKDIQERLGFGETTYKKVIRIGKLDPVLRTAVRGTAAEHDQSKLLKLAKLSRDEQVKVAAALREDPDIGRIFKWLKGPKPTATVSQSAILKKLISSWDDASEETRTEFLQHIGMEPTSTLRDLLENAA